jgi:hypothetical protein
MRAATCWIITGLIATGIIFGQQRSNGRVKVLTVCEVLGDARLYADTAVAVVGRMERSVSLIDHYEFLSQDQCEYPVITHGYTWSDQIQVWSDWEAWMPKPPSDRPKLERLVVATKLSIVRKTTKLGSHQEPQFKAEGRSIVYSNNAEAPNEWAVVYGRIVRVPNPDEDCGADVCGGDNAPLVIIAEPYNVHRLRDDATPLPDDK